MGGGMLGWWGGMHGCQGGVHGCWGGGHAWLRGHAWLLGGVHGCWGACMVAGGDMHGCWGACVVKGECMVKGGMCGKGGVCMVAKGGCVAKGGHVWDTTKYGDTINERAVRILLECILVHLTKILVLIPLLQTLYVCENVDWKYLNTRQQARLCGQLLTP